MNWAAASHCTELAVKKHDPSREQPAAKHSFLILLLAATPLLSCRDISFSLIQLGGLCNKFFSALLGTGLSLVHTKAQSTASQHPHSVKPGDKSHCTLKLPLKVMNPSPMWTQTSSGTPGEHTEKMHISWAPEVIFHRQERDIAARIQALPKPLGNSSWNSSNTNRRQ